MFLQKRVLEYLVNCMFVLEEFPLLHMNYTIKAMKVQGYSCNSKQNDDHEKVECLTSHASFSGFLDFV